MVSDVLEIPFAINVPQSELEALHRKLADVRLPDQLEDVGSDYGAPLEDIKRLLARWKDGYDWRECEAELNKELPQFARSIEVDHFGTLDIHYVHKKSELETAIPLLFVHGCRYFYSNTRASFFCLEEHVGPGNFMEIRKILPLLTASSPDYPSFHVVALSLPGYGFSSAPTKKGFKIDQYAEVAHKLMLALGYDEYVTQGGDWGYYITKRIAQLYGGKHAKAWHTNYPRRLNTISAPTFWEHPLIYLADLVTPLTEREKAGLDRTQWFQSQGRGYHAEHSTQPQTIGYSLADSPVGLLAWIYEKLVNWTDNYAWQDDEVLTWVSLYWFSRSGPAASIRIYYEVFQASDKTTEESSIPVGYSYFPKELYCVPRRWLWERNLVFEAEHAEGGHFAAHEKPESLVGDLRKMFGKGGPAYNVVNEKNGFRNDA